MRHGNSVNILARLLKPVSRCMTVESARLLASLKPDPLACRRVAELAEKCNEGLLNPDERREYETYVQAGNIIAILKTQARLYLKQKKTAA